MPRPAETDFRAEQHTGNHDRLARIVEEEIQEMLHVPINEMDPDRWETAQTVKAALQRDDADPLALLQDLRFIEETRGEHDGPAAHLLDRLIGASK